MEDVLAGASRQANRRLPREQADSLQDDYFTGLERSDLNSHLPNTAKHHAQIRVARVAQMQMFWMPEIFRAFKQSTRTCSTELPRIVTIYLILKIRGKSRPEFQEFFKYFD